jgi:hypothetical protein
VSCVVLPRKRSFDFNNPPPEHTENQLSHTNEFCLDLTPSSSLNR